MTVHAIDTSGEGELAADYLEDNLALLDLEAPTLDLVRAAPPSARVELLGDLTPVLRARGQILGLPLAESSVAPSSTGVTVVFGLGVGHTVRALRDQGDGAVVVYEPDPAVVRAVLEFGPTDLGGIDVVCTIHDLAQIWPRLARGRGSATLIRTPGYQQAYPTEDRALTEAIQQLVERTTVNSTTHRVRAQEWVRYALGNIGALCEAPSFHALAGKYPGVPMFIVGAGPSLGKNGKLLALAAKKGIVIAVNTSARALSSYGVEPQVVACIESIDVSHLLRDLPYIDRVVRAFSLSAHPSTMATGGGPLLPVYEALPQLSIPLEQLTGFPGLAVCGSVSTIAFSLAHRLGASPIVFVGQDLAYTGGEAYAPGTAYEASRVRTSADGTHIDLDWCDTLRKTHDAGGTAMHDREPLTCVTAWGGRGTELSGPSFNFVRGWLEDAARVLARATPNLRLVNATEGGARLEGFEEVTLASVLEGLPDRNITAASIAADADGMPRLPPERIAAWASAQARLTSRVGRAAARVRRFAERAARAVEGGRARTVTRSFSGLERAELRLKESVSQAPLVDAWACAAIEAAMKGAAGSEPPPSRQSSSDDARDATRREAEVARIIEASAAEIEAALRSVAARFA